MSHLKLYLFGPPRIERDGRPIELKLRKGQALLAYLAVEAQTHDQHHLAALLWPDSNKRSALASLHRMTHEVNQVLDCNAIQLGDGTIALAAEAEVWLDVAAFRQRISCLNGHQPEATLSPGCLDRLEEAAELQFHPFLTGFSVPDCPEFEEWQFFQSESLCQTLLRVLQTLIGRHAAQGDYKTAIRYAHRWVSIEPWYELAHRTLMILYVETGQPALALRQFEQCRRMLYNELDLEPESATVKLYEAIKAGEPTPPI